MLHVMVFPDLTEAQVRDLAAQASFVCKIRTEREYQPIEVTRDRVLPDNVTTFEYSLMPALVLHHCNRMLHNKQREEANGW